MDVMGLRALLCVLVVLGCVFAVGPATAVVDGDSGGSIDASAPETGLTVVNANESTMTGPSWNSSQLQSGTGDSTSNSSFQSFAQEEPDNETDDGNDSPTNETDDGNDSPDNETTDDGNETATNETDDDVDTGQEDLDDPAIEGYDELRIEIDVLSNGSATWTLEYQYRLDDEGMNNETLDWEDRRAEIEEREDAYLEMFVERWNRAVAGAANETDRNMSIASTTLSVEETDTPHEYGYIRFSFVWHEFAHVELNRIEIGDAIDGFELDDRTQMRLTWPESHNATEIEPNPDDRRESAIIWNGADTSFLDDEPRVLLLENGESRPAEAEEPGTAIPGSWWIVGIFLALAVVGVGGWILTQTDRWGGSTNATGTAAGTGEHSDVSSTSSEPPVDLLSNEERVVRLLSERGGRMKQQEVVSTLEWTEAKTSQVVGTLRDAGDVDVFRIGRENVLVLSDDEDASHSVVGQNATDAGDVDGDRSDGTEGRDRSAETHTSDSDDTPSDRSVTDRTSDGDDET